MDKIRELVLRARRRKEFKDIRTHTQFYVKHWGKVSYPTDKDIADKFGCSESTASNIKAEYKEIFNK